MAREMFIGNVLMETPKALLFQDHYWEAPDWMPKSQVQYERDADNGEVLMTASAWICGQKGIREFEYRKAPEPIDQK